MSNWIHVKNFYFALYNIGEIFDVLKSCSIRQNVRTEEMLLTIGNQEELEKFFRFFWSSLGLFIHDVMDALNGMRDAVFEAYNSKFTRMKIDPFLLLDWYRLNLRMLEEWRFVKPLK